MNKKYKEIYNVKHAVYHEFENGDFFSDVKYFEKKNKDKLNICSSDDFYNEKIKSGSFDYSAIYGFKSNFVNDFSIYYNKCSAIIHRDDIALIQAHLEKHEDTQLNAIVNFLTENTNIQSVYYNFYYQTVENYDLGLEKIETQLYVNARNASCYRDVSSKNVEKLFNKLNKDEKKYVKKLLTDWDSEYHDESLENAMIQLAVGVDDYDGRKYFDLDEFQDFNFDYDLLVKLLNRNYIEYFRDVIENSYGGDSLLEQYKWHEYGNKSCLVHETIDEPEIYFGCRFLYEYEATDKDYEKYFWIKNVKHDFQRFYDYDDDATDDELFEDFKKSFNRDNPYKPAIK
jgi:hypothetical protein